MVIAIVILHFFESGFVLCHLGQQIDTSGGLILSDSIFTSEHIHNLFEENSTFVIEQLQILLPFVSHQWTRLLKQKCLKHVEIDDVSKEGNGNSEFGENFSAKLMQILNSENVSFDFYNKLVPRDSSGTSKDQLFERKTHTQRSLRL